MKTILNIFILMVVSLTETFATPKITGESFSENTVQEFIDDVIKVPNNNLTTPANFLFRYHLYYPYNPAPNRKLKLLVAIHGTPSACTEIEESYYVGNSNPLSRSFAYMRNSLDYYSTRPLNQGEASVNGFVVLAPAFCHGYANKENADQLINLINKIGLKYPFVETQKIFLWGQSQGGEFVHKFLEIHPLRVEKTAVLAPGYYPGVWNSSTYKENKVQVVISPNDCGCSDASIDCHQSSDNNWNAQCQTNGNLRNKWRRQKRALQFVCCNVAANCSIDKKNQFNPDPTSWHPTDSSASCEQFYDPTNPNFEVAYSCQPPARSANQCKDFSFKWSPTIVNSDGVWAGHDGYNNFNTAKRFLFRKNVSNKLLTIPSL